MTPGKSHLESVNESYLQHMMHALSFTAALFCGAFYCLVHAFLPFLFEKRGSAIIQRLHERMVVNRHLLSSRLQSADTKSVS